MFWQESKRPNPSGRKVEEGFYYSSGNNQEWLSVEQIRVAVAHDRKIQVFRAAVRIGSNKQLIRYQFRTTVKIYRIDCLVRRECDHLLDACVITA